MVFITIIPHHICNASGKIYRDQNNCTRAFAIKFIVVRLSAGKQVVSGAGQAGISLYSGIVGGYRWFLHRNDAADALVFRHPDPARC